MAYESENLRTAPGVISSRDRFTFNVNCRLRLGTSDQWDQ